MMKKILFILDHLKGGGAERIALELCEELQKRNLTIKIILLDGDDIKMQINSNLDIDSMDMEKAFLSGKLWRNRDKKFLPKDRLMLRKKIDEYQPDCIVVSHWYAYCVHSIFQTSDKVFFWVHGEIFNPERKQTPNFFRYYKEYRRWYLEHKYFPSIFNHKNIIAVNADLKLRYQPYIPNAKIFVLPNGINLQKIQQQANIGVQNTKQWDCIFVGRLGKEKQPEHAIQAFAKSGLMGRMAVVGDGDMMSSLQTLCQSLGVAERVDFLGWQTNPYQYIVQSCCLVLSSNTEGSPLVIAESLLLGVPVVAYDLNHGIRHQLNHQNLNRGLVESQNIEKMALALSDVVKNPYPISDEDKERLSMEKMTEDFLTIIENN